ncbi:HEPN domain-containing protein [uncultured Microbacterium sp.]|uniref:ApeA N-terminal domain 1-containing protein n=1 Tax=uncultured Microbacterium sp. TaxID=191216 RepID=UPI0035CA45C0
MQAKSFRGYWWLPSRPDVPSPGQLTVAEDGRCELQLIGGLDLRPEDPTHGIFNDRVPILHGEAEGKPITLLDCFTIRGDGLAGHSGGRQDIHVHEALIGVHVRDEEAAFTAAILTLEHLASWLALDRLVERSEDLGVETAKTRPPEPRTCTVDGWTITARVLAQPFHVETERSRLAITGELGPYLVISASDPVRAVDFHGVVLELMDLLTLASGEASGQIGLTLVHKDPIPHRDVDGTTFEYERRVDCYGSRTHTARPSETATADWRFLFSCRDQPFEELVPRWLALRRKAPEACNVLFGVRYSRPTYTEVRLLLAAITAETLHSSLYGDETELSTADFERIREAVLGALDDPIERQWARQRLRNSPSFRERLASLASKPDRLAMAAIVPDTERWTRQVRDARNLLAHTGNESTDEDIFRLERVTTAVLSLVLMSELGLSAETQQRAARDVLRVEA